MSTIAKMPGTARLWVYQATPAFPEDKAAEIKAELGQFASQWTAHNQQLQASADLLHNRFVVLVVDERQAGASGCSIDSSVRFLKSLQARYGTDLFNRMAFSYEQDGEVFTVPREEFAALYASGAIDDETIVFDTLVESLGAFEAGWRKPLGQSWHKRLV